MLQQFKEYVLRENICRKSDSILLAVSGGMDSMVMSDLFIRSGFDHLFIAHCNFGLRGNESDRDEAFVRRYAAEHDIEFFCKKFDTKAYADSNGVSIQMAARELRYNWFHELLEEQRLDLISTAHHADDNIETFFINLLRGSGISGLKGIRPRNANLIRPLLFAERNQIDAYRKDQQIKYREDRSNSSVDYLRNKIRLKFLPVLKDIEPDYRNAVRNSMNNLYGAEKLYRKMLDDFRKAFIKKDELNRIYIPIDKLLLQQHLDILLFELLNPYGFGAEQIDKIIGALDAIPGKIFYSETQQLLIDREFLIITASNSSSGGSYLINIDDRKITNPVELEIQILKLDPGFKIPKEKLTACLDFDKLQFPLEVTGWKQGDSFRPLGMKGKKKVSDFFIDEKFSRIQKEETCFLRSAGKIVWIIGHRIDEEFKISNSTKRAYLLKFNA